jgi:hypothetical protein
VIVQIHAIDMLTITDGGILAVWVNDDLPTLRQRLASLRATR